MTQNEQHEELKNFEKRIHVRVDNNINKFHEINLKYIDIIQANCNKLQKYKLFIEIEGLQLRWWESYITVKCHLKRLACENTCNDKKKNEEAFYEWLKICVNSKKEPNYDFYLEKKGFDKEVEVKQILFEDNGTDDIREIFKDDNGQIRDEWQIRLKTIASWFLKRYDLSTAMKILNSCDKSRLDKINLILPRLLVAIFIGFLPLIFNQGTWELALNLGLWWVILISSLLIAISIFYFQFECYNITRNKKTAKKRGLFVGIYGLVISLFFSIIIVISKGEFFVGYDYKTRGLNVLGRIIFLEDILFILIFASAALLIGIFIQIFWEEKTITESL